MSTARSPSAAEPAPSVALVASILAQTTFGLLAMTICLPSMPEWNATFAQSGSWVQLTFSGFVLTYGSFQLLYGPWSDRLGRQQVLLVGLFIAWLGSMLAAWAPNVGVLVAARCLQGAGCAASLVVSRAMVQDHFQGAQRTRMMAYIGMAMGLCPPTAALLGGQVHVAWGWQANFLLIAGLAMVLAGLAWRTLQRDRDQAHARPAPAQPASARLGLWAAYRQLARERRFLLLVGVLAMTTTTFYCYLGGAPLVLASYGVGPQGVGLYIMTIPGMYIVGNFLTSRWVRMASERRILVTGQSCTLLGLLGMTSLAALGWHHPLAMALPLMLLGLGHGLLVPATLAGTVGLMPALAGAAAAVAGLMQQVMGALGGYLVGLLPHHNALPMGLLMMASSLLATACLWGALRQYSK